MRIAWHRAVCTAASASPFSLWLDYCCLSPSPHLSLSAVSSPTIGRGTRAFKYGAGQSIISLAMNAWLAVEPVTAACQAVRASRCRIQSASTPALLVCMLCYERLAGCWLLRNVDVSSLIVSSLCRFVALSLTLYLS